VSDCFSGITRRIWRRTSTRLIVFDTNREASGALAIAG
jgi:hypothetical protein